MDWARTQEDILRKYCKTLPNLLAKHTRENTVKKISGTLLSAIGVSFAASNNVSIVSVVLIFYHLIIDWNRRGKLVSKLLDWYYSKLSVVLIREYSKQITKKFA